jgi:hypothetical protein
MTFWNLSVLGNSNINDLKAKVRDFVDKLRAEGHPVENATIHSGEVERLDPQPPVASTELPKAAPAAPEAPVEPAPPAEEPLPTEAAAL